MNALFRFIAVAFFLVGMFAVGILGTSTSFTFIWPGYFGLGVAGLMSIVAIFSRNKFNIPFWCIGGVFLVVGYLLLRAVNSPVVYFAREDGVLLVACFIIYMIFLSLIDSARWRQGLFWTIVGLLAFNVILALAQLSWGGGFWLLSDYERTFDKRVGGVFNHPDHFAGFMALGVVYLCSMVTFGHHSKLRNALLVLLALGCFLMIIVAESLLGLLAAGVGLGCLGFVVIFLTWTKLSSKGRRRSVAAYVLALLVVGMALGVNHEAVTQHLIKRDGETGITAAWSSGLEQFAESPFAGTGSRTSYYYSRKFHPEGSNEIAFHQEAEFAHNEYIQLLADYGLVGLLLVCGLVLLHLLNGFRFIRGYAQFQTADGRVLVKSNHLGFVVAAFTGVMTLAFLSFFDFVMHIPSITMFSALFLGFLACPDPMSRALHAKEDKERTLIPGGWLLFAGRSVTVGAGLGLLIFSFVFGRSEWHLEMARVKYENNQFDTNQRDHLTKALSYDRSNPFILSLMAHSYVKAIKPEMSMAQRTAYLEKAEQYFSKAEELYPHDIHRAAAHSVVLDQLGRSNLAGVKLADAREWAPLYSNLMVAQGEHFLRTKEYTKAERSFQMAQNTPLFRDDSAIDQGLAVIADWKGIGSKARFVTTEKEDLKEVKSLLKEGKAEEVEISGKIGSAINESLELIEKKLGGKIVLPANRHEPEDIKQSADAN